MKSDVLIGRKVQSSGSTFDEANVTGLLREGLDKEDKLALSKKNIEGDTKHVMLFIIPKGKKEPVMVMLSEGLSKDVRKAHSAKADRKSIIKSLLNMRVTKVVIQNEAGDDVEWSCLIRPAGAFEAFSFDQVSKGEPVALEDLIA